MKDNFEKAYIMGLGAMELTSKKAVSLKKEFLDAGEKLYNDAESINDDLKNNMMNKAKERIIRDMTKEDVIAKIKTFSDKDKEDIIKVLKEETRG